MDEIPLSPDMWSDDADTEHLNITPNGEDLSADDTCFNALFKTPLSAPRRRGTPLNRSISFTNTGPVISQIPESLLPIVNHHDISWTSSLATPIVGDATNISTNFNSEERKVLLSCKDETHGRRLLFLESDSKKAMCLSDKTPKPARSRTKNCVKSLQSTPTLTANDALPREIPLSPILSHETGEPNKTPLTARVSRNRRLSSERHLSLQSQPAAELRADQPSSPSILDGQAVVTLSPPKSPIIGLRVTSRSKKRRTRLSLRPQELTEKEVSQSDNSEHKSIKSHGNSANLKATYPIIESLTVKQSGDCVGPLKGVETLKKDVPLSRCQDGTLKRKASPLAYQAQSVERSDDGLIAGSMLVPEPNSLQNIDVNLTDDTEIASSPIISFNKIKRRKLKRSSRTSKSSDSELTGSSPFKVPKNSLSSDGSSSQTSTQKSGSLGKFTQKWTDKVEGEALNHTETERGSPKAPSGFSSESDLSMNTIQEIYKATDLIAALDDGGTEPTTRQTSKMLKFVSTSEKGEQKQGYDQDQKCVESRVRRIKTTSALCFLYPRVDVKRETGIRVDIGQLGEYARLLEAAASAEGRAGKRIAAMEVGKGFVPFSKMHHSDLRQAKEVSSAEGALVDCQARVLRSRKVIADACEESGGISSTQITRLVADAEKMFDTEDSQWGYNILKETGKADHADKSSCLDGASRSISIGSDSFSKASGVEEVVSVDCVSLDGKTPKAMSTNLMGFSSASGKNLSASESAMRKAKSLFDEEKFPCEDLDTPKGRAGKLAGFSSASGKKLSISKIAMNNARKLFNELDSKEILEEIAGQVSEFRTSESSPTIPGGKKLQATDESSTNARKLFSGVIDDADLKTPKSGLLGGFSSASGKKLNVSDAAMKRARSLFEEAGAVDSKDLDVLKPNGDFPMGFSSASGKKFNVSEESMKKARTLFEDVESPLGKDTNVGTPKFSNTMSMGFSSASGKKFNVSEESMKKAKTLFEDVESPLGKDKNVGTPKFSNTMSMGFSSASGKKFNVSEESMKKARTLFEDAEYPLGKDTNVETPKNNKTPMGFSSASGKKCSVSEASIKRARTFFCDDDAQLQNKTEDKHEAVRQPSKLQPNRPRNSAFKRPSRTESPRKVETTDKTTKPAINDENSADNISRATEVKISLANPTEFVVCNAKDSVDDLPNETEIAEVLQATEAFLADEESGFPSWITTYTSSPSEATDRMDMSKPMVDGVDLRGSPLLGRHDRFRKAVKVETTVKAVKNDPTVFQTPYRKSEKGTAVGDRRRGADLEFGTPFAKRPKPEQTNSAPNVNQMELSAVEVARLREEAWETQKKLVKSKDSASCRPCQGSQLLRKLGQLTSWKDLTRGNAPGRVSRTQLVKLGLRENVVSVTPDNAADFVFSAHNHYGPSVCRYNVLGLPVGDAARLVLDANGHADAARFESAFLSSPGVDPKLVPSGWVRNHLRWIVWKLAATEMSFPRQFAARCLTPNVVMLQLKYRYDREIDRSERPALRRVLEQDDAASRRMVLCVARIVPAAPRRFELELTDGWYSVLASLDSELSRIVGKGGITVGTKLVIHGAELSSREPCYPLEAKPDVRLRLNANSTRRARWHAQLGFQACPGPMTLSLRNLLPGGGLIGRVDVRIARVYHTLFVETLPSGDKVTRSELGENRAATAFERLRRDRVEAVYASVRAELRDAERTEAITTRSRRNIANVTSGSQLCRLLEQADDPASLQVMLTADQLAQVEEHRRRTADGVMRQVEVRVQKALEEEGGKRNVATLLKLRCTDVDCTSSAVLSIWRASDDLAATMCEGAVVSVFNVSAAGFRNESIQLTAGRQARFQSRPAPAPPDNFSRCLTTFRAAASASFRPKFSEADVVGVVTLIVDGNSQLQTVYLADAALDFVGIAVWNGLKASGLDEILQPGAVVCVADLQWRAAPARRVPHFHVTEMTAFSRRPRQPHFRSEQEILSSELKQDCDFVEKAREKLLSVLKDTSMPIIQPQPMPNPTPLLEIPEEKKLSAAQQRIERLRCYSDPPSLPPLAITNSQSIAKEFRTPSKSEPAKDEEPEDTDSPPLSLDSSL